MSFEEIVDAVKSVKTDQRTVLSEGYFEVIIRWTDAENVSKIFEKFFGKATKPAGEYPSPLALSLSAPYGGIRQNQVMFSRVDGETLYLAMLWPWSDGMLITVKVIKGKNPGPALEENVSIWEKIFQTLFRLGKKPKKKS